MGVGLGGGGGYNGPIETQYWHRITIRIWRQSRHNNIFNKSQFCSQRHCFLLLIAYRTRIAERYSTKSSKHITNIVLIVSYCKIILFIEKFSIKLSSLSLHLSEGAQSLAAHGPIETQYWHRITTDLSAIMTYNIKKISISVSKACYIVVLVAQKL
jgi:hypothetical protein